jgi:hypothetical protein
MKKCKLLAASTLVSLSLISTSALSVPTKLPKKNVEVQLEQPFSEWFFDLFSF